MYKKNILLIAISIIICTFALFLVTQLPFIHSSPECSVDSCDALADRLNGICILPDRSTYCSDECSYTLLLKSRYSNVAIGYLIDSPSPAEKSNSITIECKALSELPVESQVVYYDGSYQNIGLDIDSNHISFILNGFRYDIHNVDGGKLFSQVAREIAQSIIDNFYLN